MPTKKAKYEHGKHPNSVKALAENRVKTQFCAGEAQVEIARRGAEASNANQKAYKSLRERLRERLTEHPEQAEEVLDIIMDGALKHKNYNAIDRIMRILGEESSQVSVSVSGGLEDALREFNERDRKIERS